MRVREAAWRRPRPYTVAAAAGLVALLGYAGAAARERCAAIADDVDRSLCLDAAFRQADRAMSAAYFELLRSIDDRDMRDALIFSQKRWVKARKVGVLMSTTLDDTPADERPELERRTLVEVTQAREAQLKRRSTDGRTSAIVATLRHQRDILATFPGGPFQGFSTECDFVSPPFGSGYACFGTVAVQSGRRVCAHSLEWASGHETDIQIVATADGTRLKQEAVCKEGYDSNYPACPRPDRSWVRPVSHRPLSVQLDEDARSRDRPMGWDRPGSYDLDLDRYPLRKLDPEGDDVDNELGFFRACTSKADFPRRSIRRSIGPALRPGMDGDR